MRKSVLLALTACWTLTACDHYSSKMAALDSMKETETVAYSQASNITDIEPAAGASMSAATNSLVSEMRFSQHLKNNYIEQARYEESVADYKAAKKYTEKVYMLDSGQMVGPASLRGLSIGGSDRADLETARAELISALQTKNIPENRKPLADAQANFDCWVDQAGEGKKDAHCHSGFTQAMAMVIDPDMSEQLYGIAFEEGKVSLTTADREAIGDILRQYAGNEDNIHSIAINAPSDNLSANRVSVLRSIMQYNGIASEKIQVMTGAPTQEIFISVKQRTDTTQSASAPQSDIQQF
ncbi:MAG: hypothetical protein AAF988_07650 [Pseudomonadota bacterium]